MTKCKQTSFAFPSCKSRKVHADFSGGNITSLGGALLLKQADRRLGLIRAAAQCIPDARRQASVVHSIREMLAQRVFAIACGEEDLNDHAELRSDIAMQTAVGTDCELASPSTLCRLENEVQRDAAVAITALFVEQFIASHSVAPKEIVLDFDATDDAVHGDRKAGSSMDTTTTTASFRSMYFADRNCSAPICAPRKSTARNMPGRSSPCSSSGYAKRGHR